MTVSVRPTGPQVVLVGYQAEGTRGRQLLDGAHTVKLLGRYVPVRACVASIDAFSVHADATELVDRAHDGAGSRLRGPRPA